MTSPQERALTEERVREIRANAETREILRVTARGNAYGHAAREIVDLLSHIAYLESRLRAGSGVTDAVRSAATEFEYLANDTRRDRQDRMRWMSLYTEMRDALASGPAEKEGV